MSIPIKPPDGPPSTPPIGGPGSTGPSDGLSEVFHAALDSARRVGEVEAAEPAARSAEAPGATVEGAGAPDAVAAIVDDLDAGRIDADAAVARLLDRVMSSGAASAIPTERRGELLGFLRRALAEDPSLIMLTKDLERGG